MKNTLLLLLCLFTMAFANGQVNSEAPWMKSLSTEKRATPLKFEELVEVFNDYWKKKDPNVKGSGFKPFKRWENYWKNFVEEDGYLPSTVEIYNGWLEKQNPQFARGGYVDESDWQSLGPYSHSNTGSWSSGQGRVNAIIVDPNIPTTFYAGAPAGGFWKSTNSGSTWKVLTDHLPQIGVSGIAIDHANSDIIYIATGDDDAGDAPSVGVWKSIDGGDTWAATGLDVSNTPTRMNDIYIDPNDSNVLWVATNGGLFKTTDAGANWNLTLSGNIRDLKIKPTDTSVIYAVSSSTFYKSVDGGDTFSSTSSELPTGSGRLVIDVTPANNEVVYVLSAASNNSFQGIYKSEDSGDTFVKKLNTTDIFETSQAWYDLALAVSDTDENQIYTGCLNIWSSSDGGDSFFKLNNWNVPGANAYTHADIHLLRFFNNELFAGTDGGFYKSANGGANFTDLTEGLQIGQFYRIAVSKQSSGTMVGGLQDNGGYSLNNNQWQNFYGADGMDTAISPENSNTHFGFIQFGGNLYISNTSGASRDSFVSAPLDEIGTNDDGGNWITPLVMNSENELYAGYSKLYKLNSNNSGWLPVSEDFGLDIDAFEIDDFNPDNIFVATNNRLSKSVDRGETFSISFTFPSNITSIEVNNNDSNIIYVTTSGFSSGRVYRSIDQGDTFTNISTGLPSVTKNIIKHQTESSSNSLYLGTSLGVYIYDDDTQAWNVFDNNFPNVYVSDLEINLVDNNITAATYGRGIWQSILKPTVPANDDVKLDRILVPSKNSLVCGAATPQINVQNTGLNVITSIDVSYTLDSGTPSNFTWNGNLISQATTTIDLPELSLTVGSHDLMITVDVANDAFTNNNSISVSFHKNGDGVSEQINTFEAESDNLITYNEDGGTPLFERGVPTGTQLNTATSGTSVYGTNLAGNHADKTKAYLFSKCYDLSSITSPTLKFNMAFATEPDWDLAYVEYTTDSGDSWNLLGSASDPNWYNSSRIAGDGIAANCNNCVGGQWTGTNTTMTAYSYNLATLASESSVIFRIVFHSDDNTNDEGMIIDDFYVDGLTPDDDNDGVANTVDNCPNTPNADQADNDNDGIGDVCDDDDDNDTILDINDNCPFTANLDQADTNGDGIGNVCDMDNDTIRDENDNCPNTPNTDQADFDNDGTGDVCDDDIDNDGVPNTNDLCNDTPQGDAVNTDGCTVFTLPSDNFRVQTTSETCRSSNNGMVNIAATETGLNYTAQLTGNGVDTSQAFTDETTFTNLEAGNYTVCITVDGQANYEVCFNITITEPEDLSVISRFNGTTNRISLELSGAIKYYVELNGQITITYDSLLELELSKGLNTIKVYTDKDCQGVYHKTINNTGKIRIYPNPLKDNKITINVADASLIQVHVELHSVVGKVILSKNVLLQDGRVTINIPNISSGLYLLDINDGNTTTSFKVIQK